MVGASVLFLVLCDLFCCKGKREPMPVNKLTHSLATTCIRRALDPQRNKLRFLFDARHSSDPPSTQEWNGAHTSDKPLKLQHIINAATIRILLLIGGVESNPGPCRAKGCECVAVKCVDCQHDMSLHCTAQRTADDLREINERIANVERLMTVAFTSDEQLQPRRVTLAPDEPDERPEPPHPPPGVLAKLLLFFLHVVAMVLFKLIGCTGVAENGGWQIARDANEFAVRSMLAIYAAARWQWSIWRTLMVLAVGVVVYLGVGWAVSLLLRWK